MRILVCGSRDWENQAFIDYVLGFWPITVLIEGEANGADKMSRDWGERHGLSVEDGSILPFPAAWHRYGRAAGPIRNSQMLQEGKPELIIAFHHELRTSRGTRNMVTQAELAGVPVIDAVYNYWEEYIEQA